jgi:hypothetical protein
MITHQLTSIMEFDVAIAVVDEDEEDGGGGGLEAEGETALTALQKSTADKEVIIVTTHPPSTSCTFSSSRSEFRYKEGIGRNTCAVQ